LRDEKDRPWRVCWFLWERLNPTEPALRRARQPSTARLANPASIIAHVEVSGTLPAPVRNTPEADVKVTPGGKSIVIGSEMSAEPVKKVEA
jgi:hypothetical protein